MDEDERLEKIIAIKDALSTIEETIMANDKLLSLTLESDMSSNQEKFKNETWRDCKSGLCPIDWVQRYPEKDFIKHMVEQDTLISKDIIKEKNLSMEEIEAMLKEVGYKPESPGITTLFMKPLF